MKVKDLMTATVTCVRPDSSLAQVASHMRQENIGTVPVCTDRGEPVGIITDRDLVIRGLASVPAEPQDVRASFHTEFAGELVEPTAALVQATEKKAEDIMTKNLVCAHPGMDIHDASILFAKYQVRRLPVTENGKLVGMLSLADIARKPFYVDEAGDALNAISKPSTLS